MGTRAERELDTTKAYSQGLFFPNLKTCIDFLFFFGVFNLIILARYHGEK
jgi:hypothetical protein